MALHAVSPAAAASPPCALSSARIPPRPGCGCLSNRSSPLSFSTNFMNLRSGAVCFFSVPLVLQHSDKRAVLRHATIEEIEAEKTIIEDQAKEKMEKALETMQTNFNTVRTGRANPAMLDRIEVEYYGTPVNLKSIAQINTPDASSLLIQPFDKSCLKLIEKAIVAANIGVTPSNDGDVIRVTVPPLTSDRRKEMAKTVAKLSEEGKVAIRNIRRDAIKAYDKLEKEKKLSEDNKKDLSADLQKITDEYMKKVESIQKAKEQVTHLAVARIHGVVVARSEEAAGAHLHRRVVPCICRCLQLADAEASRVSSNRRREGDSDVTRISASRSSGEAISRVSGIDLFRIFPWESHAEERGYI